MSNGAQFLAAERSIITMRREGYLIREIIVALKAAQMPYATDVQINRVLRKAGLVKGCTPTNFSDRLNAEVVALAADQMRAEESALETLRREIIEEAALVSLSDEMDALWGKEIPADSPRAQHAKAVTA